MKILDFGLIDYKEAYLKQLECVQKVIDGAEPMLIFCEHMPVLTLGRLAKREYILASDDELKDKGVSIHNIDRGGEVTLHAPGQLVVYPIIDLKKHSKDLHVYLHNLEEVVIALLTEFDIVSSRVEGNTGAWVKDKKLASIGVGVKKWVTYHGIGININTDLNLFKLIQPCGLEVIMTSIKNITGKEVDISKVKSIIFDKLCNIYSNKE